MNSYLLFKSLHLISVISWMAGLLYLPRIFVYHSENNNEVVTAVFKTMERKLFYYIMTPAMTLSWLFGLVLIHEIGFQQLTNLWLQLKLILFFIPLPLVCILSTIKEIPATHCAQKILHILQLLTRSMDGRSCLAKGCGWLLLGIIH